MFLNPAPRFDKPEILDDLIDGWVADEHEGACGSQEASHARQACGWRRVPARLPTPPLHLTRPWPLPLGAPALQTSA